MTPHLCIVGAHPQHRAVRANAAGRLQAALYQHAAGGAY